MKNVLKHLGRAHRPRLLVPALALLVALGVIFATKSFAFKPKKPDHGHSCITASALQENHPGCRGVPINPANRFSTTLSAHSGGKKIYFSTKAQEDVVRGVESNDWIANDMKSQIGFSLTPDHPENPFEGDAYNANAHCDDELIDGCRKMILARLQLAMDELAESYEAHKAFNDDVSYKRVVNARMWIGKALHAIQDFYSHSNYSELDAPYGAYYKPLTQQAFIPSNQQTVGDHCKPRKYIPGVTDLFPFPYTFKNFTWDNNPGNYEIITQPLLTTGYFTVFSSSIGRDADAPDAATPEIGGSRCDHGFDGLVPVDWLPGQPSSAGFGAHISGINKDVPDKPLKPGPPLSQNDYHNAAAAYAGEHTRQFLKIVEAEVGKLAVVTPRESNETEAEVRDLLFQLLLGRDPEIVFVVDRSGSMDDIMVDVKTQLNAVKPVTIDGEPLEMKYKLVSFSEKNVGGVWQSDITVNAGGAAGTSGVPLLSMKSAMETLVTQGGFGGGDCPEPSMAALLEAIKIAPNRSRIYLFTDAAAKDANRATEVITAARNKDILITLSVSGSCSPISPAYYQIAAATGGQVLVVDHADGGAAPAFASIGGGGTTGEGSFQPVHIERGVLAIAGSKTISIPVESGATRLSFTVNNDSGGIFVRNPQGISQAVSTYLGGGVVQVDNPVSGNWSITVAGFSSGGPSNYSVDARIAGQFELKNATYDSTTEIGRGSHEYHKALGITPPATDVRLSAELRIGNAQNLQTHRWEALAEDGAVLGTLDISRLTPVHFAGKAELQTISNGATRSWRIKVSGTDAQGRPFARVLPELHNAKRHTIDIVDTPTYWVVGGDNRVRIKVDNYGASDNFGLNLTSTVGTVSNVTPASTVIATQNHGVFEFKVTLPSNAASNTKQTVSIAIAAGGQTIETVQLPFIIEMDTDGDGAPDRIEKGPVGTDAIYDGNGDGVPDWNQSKVVSMYSQEKRVYITVAVTNGEFRTMRAVPADDKAQSEYSVDLLDFRIVGLASGGQTQLQYILPNYMTAAGYGKFGAEPGNLTPHWYAFNYDSASQTGAVIDKHVITLHLKDGGRGDDDLQANGVIADPGGPTNVTVAGSRSASATPPSGTSPTAPGPTAGPTGGGGGCTVGDPKQVDLSLPLLALLALLGLAYRSYRQRRS